MDNEKEAVFQQPCPAVELSVKDNGKNRDRNQKRYTVICRIEAVRDGDAYEISVRRWAKGKRKGEYFTGEHAEKTTAFSGDRFDVKKAGRYTVYVMDASGNESVETVVIKKSRLLIILLPIIILVGAGVAYSALSPGRPISNVIPSLAHLIEGGHGKPGPVSSETSSEILARLKKEEVMVTDNVGSSIHFSSGTVGSIGNWQVQNDQSNNVIMQAVVELNGQQIAKSVPIYPGEHIDSITLSQQLSPGTYDAIAYMNYYNTSTKAYLSKAGYKVKLTVG